MDSAAEELAALCGKSLSLVERLGHQHWKVRQQAYDSFRADTLNDEICKQYAPIIMGECLRESTPEAFDSLLSMLLHYVKQAALEDYGRYIWKLNKFIKHNTLHKDKQVLSTQNQRTIIQLLVTLRERGSWEIMPTFAIDATPMICHLLDVSEENENTTYLNEAIQHLAAWAHNVQVRKNAVVLACAGHAVFLPEFERLCDDSEAADEAEGETLLFRPSQKYALLTEVTSARNVDALEYWSTKPPTRTSIALMDSPELAECIAAFVLRYNARNAHRYQAVRDVLHAFFERQAITGSTLVGPFRLSEDTFVHEVLAAFERDPRIKRRLGDTPTLRRLHAELERDTEITQVEEEEFENVSQYQESGDDEDDEDENDDEEDEEMEGDQEEEEEEQADEVEIAHEEEDDVNAELEEL